MAQRTCCSVARDADAPLLGALGDVAFEGREANVPNRRRQRVVHQFSIRLGSRFAPDELVPRPLLPVVARELDRRHSLPLVADLHAARGERLFGDRDRRVAVEGQHRRIDAKRREREPGNCARDPKQWQRALKRRGQACDRSRRHPRHVHRLRQCGDRRLPCAVAQRLRQFAPCTRVNAPPHDDREWNKTGSDDQRLLDERIRRIDEEYRNREQREIERRVKQHRRQQPEPQEDQRPDHRRHDQLDQPRVRRKTGVVGVRAAEHHGLQHKSDRDAQRAMAVT